MPGRIEDYAMVGDLQTAALVGSDGSVDWLCFPRFDSPACFAALLGSDSNGRWRLAPHEERGGEILSRFTLSEGERVPFVLTWSPSYGERPVAIDGLQAVDDTERFWLDWAGSIGYDGRFQDAVYRSLLTLKGLTYEPSGGIVAAATTSLPETLGGSRNWDYRYCWLRDSIFTLGALIGAGLHEEARA